MSEGPYGFVFRAPKGFWFEMSQVFPDVPGCMEVTEFLTVTSVAQPPTKAQIAMQSATGDAKTMLAEKFPETYSYEKLGDNSAVMNTIALTALQQVYGLFDRHEDTVKTHKTLSLRGFAFFGPAEGVGVQVMANWSGHNGTDFTKPYEVPKGVSELEGEVVKAFEIPLVYTDIGAQVERLAGDFVNNFRFPAKVLLGWKVYGNLCAMHGHYEESGVKLSCAPQMTVTTENGEKEITSIVTTYGDIEIITDPISPDRITILENNAYGLYHGGTSERNKVPGHAIAAPSSERTINGLRKEAGLSPIAAHDLAVEASKKVL